MTVIVGFDGSETARVAVDEAVRLASGLALPLHVVWVIDERDHTEVADLWKLDQLDGRLADRNKGIAAAAGEVLEKLAAELEGQVTTVARSGQPAKVLIEEAQQLDASIIVVGNKNTHGLRRVLGSVASEVIHHAPCGVYVAKTT